MIAVQHVGDEVLAVYRELLAAASPPYLLIANAVEPEVAAGLRAALDAAGAERFEVADRGRYRWNGSLRVDELWRELTTLASGVIGRPLEIRGARWLHFGRGDYALVKDDSRTRPAGATVELTLDLSAAVTTEAEQVYAEGPAAILVPQLPHLLTIVVRSPAMTRYDRPITLRAGGHEVVRLRVWLGDRLSERAAAGATPHPDR